MATSLVSPQPHNYFFINLLYQPYIAMANRLIRIEDVASIASTTGDQLTERAPAQWRPNPTSPTLTAPPYQSAKTTTTKSLDWPPPQAPPSHPEQQQWSSRPLGRPMATCSSRTPRTSPPPSASSKNEWTRPKTGPSKPRIDSKSCSATRKTNPRHATIPTTATAAAAPPPTTNRNTKACAPSGSRRTPGRRRVLHPRRRREPTRAQVRTIRPGD
jgi:hypothetical protein